MRTPQLEADFLATTYRVEAQGASFDLRIGLPDREFDRFLTRQGASNWGIVTAYNPGAILTLEQNAQRHAALQAKLKALGWQHFPASNHADSGKWPVESGFCVFDASAASLSRLATEFGQAAIVFGQAGQGGGRLVWLNRLVTQ